MSAGQCRLRLCPSFLSQCASACGVVLCLYCHLLTYCGLQAQALLTKNLLYQTLDSCLHRLASCSPAVYSFLPRMADSSSSSGGEGDAGDVVTAVERDAAVTHLRFLNVFCNFRHDTFAHAVQLLDLVLGRVKVTTSLCSSPALPCKRGLS